MKTAHIKEVKTLEASSSPDLIYIKHCLLNAMLKDNFIIY